MGCLSSKQRSPVKGRDRDRSSTVSANFQFQDDNEGELTCQSIVPDEMIPNYGSIYYREKLVNLHASVRPHRKHHEAISARPVDVSKAFVPPCYPKTSDTVRFIDNALGDNFIFAFLTEGERRLLIDAMMEDCVPAGKTIIRQGDVGTFFYVVKQGIVRVSVDGSDSGDLLTQGCSFGELALLYDCPRSATCTSMTDCHLWKVGQDTFRGLLVNKAAAQQRDVMSALRNIPLLSKLDDSTLTLFSDAMTTVAFHEGETILNKGDVGDVFYIVVEGTAKAHNIGFGDSQFVDQHMHPGEWFGERAMLTGEPRNATVTAMTQCTCLCLSREAFEAALGPLQNLIDRVVRKRSLMRIPIIAQSDLKPHEIDLLVDNMVEVAYQKEALIVEQGKRSTPCLRIVSSGRVFVANENGLISNMQTGDYFGEKDLCGEGDCVSHETATADVDSTCIVITKEAIESVIGSVDRLGKSPAPASSKKLDTAMTLDDLNQVKIIGTGTYGKVWLVHHKMDKRPYALKVLTKQEIARRNQVKNVIRERNILASIDHPFVINLVGAFQDSCQLYLVEDIVECGELFDVIYTDTSAGLEDRHASFYAACVLEALSHLHERNVCYRDLKPENILLDSAGYIVLVDFGFAKIVTDKTYTFCGSPEYLAPEIILSKGHHKGADYWALGVLIYEMLAGSPPFYSKDQTVPYSKIVRGSYCFPQGGRVSDVARDIIRRLLKTNVAHRLGCLSRGSRDIADHEWLDSYHSDELLSKTFQPPWIPPKKNSLESEQLDSSIKKVKEDLRPHSQNTLAVEQQMLFRDF